MSIVYEQRASDSPYIETVTRGYFTSEGSTVRPAENHWHMVFVTAHGHTHPLFVGPLTASGVVAFGGAAEVLWIKFRLGTFMPHLPARDFLDCETLLPEAAFRGFWLKGSVWQIPDYENAETFAHRLAREDILLRDPVVARVVQGEPHTVASRTVRHHFQMATGLTHNHIRQMQRAQQASDLLQRGTPILDVVYQLGYFDQPHLTRAMKRFLGKTPAQQYVPSCEAR